MLIAISGTTIYIKKLINTSLVIKLSPELSPEALSKIYTMVKKAELRNIGTDPIVMDTVLEKYYNTLHISTIYSQKKNTTENIIEIDAYYPVVDISHKLNRLDNEQEKHQFNAFKNDVTNDVLYTTVKNLSLDKRILIRKKNAQPIVFYKLSSFTITNHKNEVLTEWEKMLQCTYLQPEELVILGFAGDTVIEHFVKYSIKQNGIDFTFKEVNDILKTPDIMSINLEFTVSNRGKKENKHFTYRSSEAEFKLIYDSDIDFACTANNHAMDYGKASLLDTISYLDKYDIKHSGSGKNTDEAFKPAIFEKKNNHLAYFAVCEVINETRGYKTMKMFKAGKDKPGIAYYDEDRLKKLFAAEKAKGNLVIIQFHTGSEYSLTPDKRHEYRAKRLIDIGADAVICHHPHVINGAGIYKNKLIAYSLGDFLFDIQKENADEGVIIFLYLLDNKIVSWSFYPTVCHYGQVLINDPRVDDVNNRFIDLCKMFVFSK